MLHHVQGAPMDAKTRGRNLLSPSSSLGFNAMLVFTLVLAGLSQAAHATEVETRDAIYERSAKVCTYHSRANVQPAIQALSIVALETLLKRKIMLCPNPKLGGSLAFVWYGEHNALAWNPDSKGAVEELAKKLDDMVKADEFPPGVEPWNVDGSRPPRGSTVPGIDYAVKDGYIWEWYDR